MKNKILNRLLLILSICGIILGIITISYFIVPPETIVGPANENFNLMKEVSTISFDSKSIDTKDTLYVETSCSNCILEYYFKSPSEGYKITHALFNNKNIMYTGNKISLNLSEGQNILETDSIRTGEFIFRPLRDSSWYPFDSYETVIPISVAQLHAKQNSFEAKITLLEDGFALTDATGLYSNELSTGSITIPAYPGQNFSSALLLSNEMKLRSKIYSTSATEGRIEENNLINYMSPNLVMITSRESSLINPYLILLFFILILSPILIIFINNRKYLAILYEFLILLLLVYFKDVFFSTVPLTKFNLGNIIFISAIISPLLFYAIKRKWEVITGKFSKLKNKLKIILKWHHLLFYLFTLTILLLTLFVKYSHETNMSIYIFLSSFSPLGIVSIYLLYKDKLESISKRAIKIIIKTILIIIYIIFILDIMSIGLLATKWFLISYFVVSLFVLMPYSLYWNFKRWYVTGIYLFVLFVFMYFYFNLLTIKIIYLL
ncbi:MAG: hypothetical protein PHU12_00645 [Candidatus Aenigmarchaeota archaeon]|nr:hypothetical protein [Candidatus Aenigmarchaeota archaeon]